MPHKPATREIAMKKLPAHDAIRGRTVRKYLVSLDPETVERARILGFGNLSGGLREAVRRARLPKRTDST